MLYRIHYPEIPNMGDQLNKCMLEGLFGITVKRTTVLGSNLSAIGSGLSGTQWGDLLSVKTKQILYYPFAIHEHHVWGTGFMKNSELDNPFYFRHMVFHSVRGELTKKRVEKIIGRNLNIPTGDGGLLADRWIGTKIEKKYQIGIIPHYKEKDHPLIDKLKQHYPKSTIVDLCGTPKSVVKHISECESILSSSLHGLIIADSFHIPNMHIQLYPAGSRIMGDGYKFSDYYSSYGLIDTPLLLENQSWPSIEDIFANYRIDARMVEIKKDQISKAFPK